ncbi:MAG: hypothetical protein ACON4F_03125 [Candidatus Puniceispirillaceae bacterium]
MSAPYDVFIGIDWSGAKGRAHAGIALACAQSGHSAPYIIQPPEHQKYWSRQAVADWLLAQSQDQKMLVGIDFAFAHPFLDEGAYYPGSGEMLSDARTLWSMIDANNADQPDFYGGGLWQHPVFGPYYNAPKNRGVKFQSRRRQTEEMARAVRAPSPTFNCVGPAGVGTGSLAGMRLLHHLGKEAQIWPFDKSTGQSMTLVEIFPSFYFQLAGFRPVNGAHTKTEAFNSALGFFDSQPMPPDFIPKGPDLDEADALISAAALRFLARDAAVWQAADQPETRQAARHEGWIFGVKSSREMPC